MRVSCVLRVSIFYIGLLCDARQQSELLPLNLAIKCPVLNGCAHSSPRFLSRLTVTGSPSTSRRHRLFLLFFIRFISYSFASSSPVFVVVVQLYRRRFLKGCRLFTLAPPLYSNVPFGAAIRTQRLAQTVGPSLGDLFIRIEKLSTIELHKFSTTFNICKIFGARVIVCCFSDDERFRLDNTRLHSMMNGSCSRPRRRKSDRGDTATESETKKK